MGDSHPLDRAVDGKGGETLPPYYHAPLLQGRQNDVPNTPPKTIVLCFDGTYQEVRGRLTNVVELCGLLSKDRPNMQEVYYDSGIGTTEGAPPLAYKIPLARQLDAWFAWTLPTHIKRGYKFLIRAYNQGDRICLFGFSRGAYVARALAGMLCKVGLLPNGWDEDRLVDRAYRLYTRTDEGSWKTCKLRKKKIAITVEIAFLGVWDTVASYSWPPKYLPFTRRNPAVKVFRHAVALDERRVKFMPLLYQSRTATEYRNKKDARENHYFRQYQPQTNHVRVSRDSATATGSQEALSAGTSEKERPVVATPPDADYTDFLEVWFSGCHSDVGGSFESDEAAERTAGRRLGTITLFWMIRQCFACEAGILFDTQALGELGFLEVLDPNYKAPIHSLDPTYLKFPVAHREDSSHVHVVESLVHRFIEARKQHTIGPPLKLSKNLLDEIFSASRSGDAENNPDPARSQGLQQVVIDPLRILRAEIETALESKVNDPLEGKGKVLGFIKKNILWHCCESCCICAQLNEETSQNTFKRNRGRGRTIRYFTDRDVKVHYTVALRLHGPDQQYKPKARYDDLTKRFPEHGVEWIEWQNTDPASDIRRRIYDELVVLA